MQTKIKFISILPSWGKRKGSLGRVSTYANASRCAGDEIGRHLEKLEREIFFKRGRA
jgi:hypothetical protein